MIFVSEQSKKCYDHNVFIVKLQTEKCWFSAALKSYHDPGTQERKTDGPGTPRKLTKKNLSKIIEDR